MKEPLITFPILCMTVIAFVAVVSGTFNLNDLATTVFLFFTVGAIVGAAASINFLGSGLNPAGTSIVFQGAALLTLWAAYSFITGSFLVFGGNIGSMIYAILTIMYAVGGILHIRGSAL